MAEKYHYTECGLDTIWLVGDGVQFIDRPSGREVRIKDIDGLHRVIGMNLVSQKKHLSGKEIRFLRQEMLMSQATLARLVDVSEQTMHRWETDKSKIPGPADALLRLLYQEANGEKPLSTLRQRLKTLADMEDALDGQDLLLSKRNKEWQIKKAA